MLIQSELNLKVASLLPKGLPENTGVLLLNMGGPDRKEDVRPFLLNLFSDPEILKMPWLFQGMLARYIVSERGEEAELNYAKMDYNGGSPQLQLTKQQADCLSEELQVPVYIAMRYWAPFTDEALDNILADGIQHLVVVSLYPHFSYTTTGSSLNELKRCLKKRNVRSLKLSVVAGYCQEPGYLKVLAELIQQGLSQTQWTCDLSEVQILISAHSLPVRHVKRTKDPYPKHILRCVQSVMSQYFPENSWDIAYQSKVGSMAWLGPATDDALAYYAGLQQDNILVVPISFVSDHVETLVEIDLDYLTIARELGIQHIGRAPVMNDNPAFTRCLAGLVCAKFRQPDLE